MRGKAVKKGSASNKVVKNLLKQNDGAYEITATLDMQKDGQAQVTLFNNKGEEAVIVDKGPKLVGFVRSGIQEDARSGLVCIISSAKEARHLKIRLPERFRQARLRCAIGDQPDVTVGADGGADFTVGARRCAVFVPVEAAASL